MKVIIVEDEEPARDLLKNYLHRCDGFELIGEATDGFEGVKLIQSLTPQLVLLDIQMPRLTGFEMLELLSHHPRFIFTTAYDTFAIKAFELNAVDYLLKPFSFDRFRSALDKVVIENTPLIPEQLTKTYLKETGNFIERLLVKNGDKVVVIPVNEVCFIESADDYALIHSGQSRHIKEITLKSLEEQLNPALFVRVHRTHLVNIHFIDRIQLYQKEHYICLMKDGSRIRMSRSGYKALKEVL